SVLRWRNASRIGIRSASASEQLASGRVDAAATALQFSTIDGQRMADRCQVDAVHAGAFE
ncbi:MAG: hypothetical protein ACRDTW_25610, partial [Rhodococcus qingshengii]